MTTAKLNYYVVWTAFHNGGIYSRHYTEERAQTVVDRYRAKTDCTCGCLDVVRAEDYYNLRWASDARHYSHPAR